MPGEPKDLKLLISKTVIMADRARYRDLKRAYLKLLGNYEDLHSHYEGAVADIEKLSKPPSSTTRNAALKRALSRFKALYTELVDENETAVTEIFTIKSSLDKHRGALLRATAIAKSCESTFTRIKTEER